MTMTKEYICPKCQSDVTVSESDRVVRCADCGQACTVDADADYENGRWIDLTKLFAVKCDCHMRSQHHEPQCPSQGSV